ncbi:deoxynucleoside kinase [Bacillus fonticola]|uniref:deoxynucleoside kinase n=1 Tax=Bacillus fonticola TaxID=2728853 RepID=UPI0014736AE7|nr:deoxynucleoside kinase [Bacillus fonticola]
MAQIPFITVEGPIGVGKTSLAKAISQQFDMPILKEIVDENPFLGKFYENIEEWSFQTEMFFLCNRYKQLEDIQKNYLHAKQPVVADYHIFKNMIFAQRTLGPHQFVKYEQIFRILTSDMPKPNVVIYLHASLDTLLRRIERRGRSIEQNMSPLYLEQLSQDYAAFMDTFEQEHPDVPVLRFNGDEFDFIHRQEDLRLIMDTIQQTLQKGASPHEPSRTL